MFILDKFFKYACCVICAAIVFYSSFCRATGTQSVKPFRIGVYIYAYRFAEAANIQHVPISRFIDEHFRILSENGVNCVYLGGCSPGNIDDYLAAANRHAISLIPQLDLCYFQSSWHEKDIVTNAQHACKIIKLYDNRPEILAWSIHEETSEKDIIPLARYYNMILHCAPNAKFNLIHTDIKAAQIQPPPDPLIIGTDRYGFWWEFSGGGYLASPQAALDWTRTQAAKFYEYAASRKADYMFVVTQGGLINIRAANALCKTPGEISWGSKAKDYQQMRSRVLSYAKEKRMGWRMVTIESENYYAFWKYYCLPENCLKACAWSAVLEGARLFFIWSYNPHSKKALDAGSIEKLASDSSRSIFPWWTMAGRPGMPNRHLKELLEASQEIRRYERIITKMVKVSEHNVKTETKNTYIQSFYIPNLSGLILVLHNANVGTWPGNSHYVFKEDDRIYINDEGELEGYQPFREPLSVRFFIGEKLAEKTDSIDGLFDLVARQKITGKDGRYSVPVKPGSGLLLFFGTNEVAQCLYEWIDSVSLGVSK